MGRPWALFDRWLVLPYFLLHIPITLLVDAQALFPVSAAHAATTLFPMLPPRAAVFPEAARAAVDWYVATVQDPIMHASPPWLQAIVAVECLVQVPFFVVAIYAFLNRTCSTYSMLVRQSRRYRMLAPGYALSLC